MKTLLLISALWLTGCACCNEAVQLPDVVTVTPRYIPISQITIDGQTLPLTVVYDGLYTAYGKLKDSTTGKTVEVNAVVKTKDSTGTKLKEPTLDLSLFVAKDSVKTNDSLRERTTIKKDDSFFQGITLKDIMIFIGVIAVIAFLITLLKR